MQLPDHILILSKGSFSVYIIALSFFELLA